MRRHAGGGCRRAVDDNAGSIVTGSPFGNVLRDLCLELLSGCRARPPIREREPACSAAASISIGPNRAHRPGTKATDVPCTIAV